MRDRTRIVTATVVAALLVASVVVFHGRLAQDFLPLDRSTIGPNLIASLVQAAVVTVVAVLLYPPWRRAVHKFLDGKLSSVHSKLDGLREHHERHHADVAEIHEKIDALVDSHKELHDKVDKISSKRAPTRRTAAPRK